MGPKKPYLGIFGPQFNKKYYQIFNQYSQIYETIKFHPKQNKTKKKLKTKNAECSKSIVMFVINTLQFVSLQSLMQKLKFLNLEPKTFYLGVLESNFEKILSFL